MLQHLQDYDTTSSRGISQVHEPTFGANFAGMYAKRKVVQNKYKKIQVGQKSKNYYFYM